MKHVTAASVLALALCLSPASVRAQQASALTLQQTVDYIAARAKEHGLSAATNGNPINLEIVGVDKCQLLIRRHWGGSSSFNTYWRVPLYLLQTTTVRGSVVDLGAATNSITDWIEGLAPTMTNRAYLEFDDAEIASRVARAVNHLRELCPKAPTDGDPFAAP